MSEEYNQKTIAYRIAGHSTYGVVRGSLTLMDYARESFRGPSRAYRPHKPLLGPYAKPVGWYIKRHRDMWHWLSINGWSSKHEWPGWEAYGDECHRDCYLCQYVIDYGFYVNGNSKLDCSRCPLDWGSAGQCQRREMVRKKTQDKPARYKETGWFGIWDKATAQRRRKITAAIISNLPLRVV